MGSACLARDSGWPQPSVPGKLVQLPLGSVRTVRRVLPQILVVVNGLIRAYSVRPVTPQLGEDARRARGLWGHACAALGSWSREATQQDGGPCVLIASVRTHCASTTSVQGLSRAAARFPSVHP